MGLLPAPVQVMLSVESIDERSKYLEPVKLLGKKHSRTLGQMPLDAFDDYASQRHIIVASKDGACLGYILYRQGKQKVSIAHFCVSEAARGQGVAHVMLDHLIKTTRHLRLRGIFLSCRVDYVATDTWPRLGFQAVSRRRGKSAKGTELVSWALDYGHPDMYSEAAETTKLKVAIDANIFIDLVDGRDVETQGLKADWLIPLVSYCYTPELLNEINRCTDSTIRRKRHAACGHYLELRGTPEGFAAAEQQLRPLFPKLSTTQSESDFRHLVWAVACDADAFVTRDVELLGRADQVFEACGLAVVRPAELIGRIDIIENERDYQRGFVAGTKQVIQTRINQLEDRLISKILVTGEHRRRLVAEINRCLANASRPKCNLVTIDGETKAFYIAEYDSDLVRVPVFRIFGNSRQSATLARALLTGLIRSAVTSTAKGVFVRDQQLSQLVMAACDDLGFISVTGGRLKLVLRGVLSANEVCTAITATGQKMDELRARLAQVGDDAAAASQIEHLISPAKLAIDSMPCFIVPIHAEYAEQLFDERHASSSLFGADVDLALNPESAYYRGSNAPIVTCPGRILWYTTESGTYPNAKSIRACSRVVEVVVDTPKRLFTRFRRLGVYRWGDVLDAAKGDNDKRITAFRFDDTEPLRPLPIAKVRDILSKHNVTHNNFVSPVKIPASVFGEIYVAALNPSPACSVDSGGR